MLIPKEICIEDRVLMNRYIGVTENSTLNFTTLYIWSIDGRIKYDITNGCLILFFYHPRGSVSCTYPMGDGDRQKAAEEAVEFMLAAGGDVRFVLMSEEMTKECSTFFPNMFRYISDRNNADYVYESTDLIHLSGKKFHQKKNHLNAFLNQYEFSYERLNPSHTEECIHLLEKWQTGLKNHDAGLSEKVTVRLLSHLDELGIALGGIRTKGSLIAFSAGEALTDDMALIHLEYADVSIRGSFNVMNQQFCENEWSAYRYINREEDMGIEGLRKAKLAYRPVKMIEKYYTENKG